MSYCRIDEDESDVYIVREGDRWRFVVRDGTEIEAMSLRQLYGLMIAFQQDGVRIPERAVDRVRFELHGGKMSFCPLCCDQVRLDTDGTFATHDIHPNLREVCAGSRKRMYEAIRLWEARRKEAT